MRHAIGRFVEIKDATGFYSNGKKRKRITYYDGNDGGYSENDLDVTFHEDGSINISEVDGEGWVYLYPEQITLLIKLLGENQNT